MSNRKIQRDILLFAVRRGLSIVCFYDFQGSFSLKIHVFERSENIDLKGPSVVYNVMQKSASADSKRLAAKVVFLSKMEATNPTPGGRRLRQSIVSSIQSM
jgi:hypothetical protein